MSEIKNRICVVTGGAGFIGSHLVEKLVEEGAKVRVIDDLSSGNNNISLLSQKGVQVIKQDISDFESINHLFENASFVFHLAAMNRAQRSIENPLRSNEINVTGTLNCLKAASDNNVEKFVFASSSSVYKGAKNRRLVEDMTLEPLHPYGVGKLSGEHYCRVFNDIYGLHTCVLRYFSVYGPRQRGGIDYAGVIAKFIRAALKNKEITIFGDGNQKRNFTYVKDVVENTIAACLNTGTNGKVINLASRKEYTVNEISNLITYLTSSKSKIVHLPPLKADPKRNFADISLLQRLIPRTETPLKEGLEKTIKAKSAKQS